jgi:phosphatidylglycerol:prolipoprotein diacylglycerol transferase
MHPILFKIGPVTIYTYGVMVAIGIFLGSIILMKLSDEKGLNRKDVADIAFWTVISGFLGARLFFFIYNPEYLNPWWRILYVWQGGLVWYGGVLFGFLTALFLSIKKKVSPWKLADISSIAGSVGLGFGRIGCTMAGCCYGKECHSHFALTFKDPHSAAPLGIPLCPTQPISSAANFLIALTLYFILRKSKTSGQVAGFYLILYGAFRFFIEFLRATPKVFLGMFSNNQIISAIMVIAGIAIFLYRKSKEEIDV